MPRLLDEISFREPARARSAFENLTSGLDAELTEQIERMLNASPDPDGALAYLLRLRELQPEAFNALVESRPALRYLVAVCSHSRFLSEELLQNPLWIRDLLDAGDVHRVRLRDDFVARLEAFLAARGGAPDALAFALVRRKAILRILIRDVLGFGTLSEVTEELSCLADAIVEVAYRTIRADLVRRYGRPLAFDSEGRESECGFAVIALGKLGGLELNYSSDIDLMFLYSENGQTEGPQKISNKEFFKKLANQLTDLLSTYTSEGLCYRVDLRLRPEGRLGEVCISLDGAKTYYRSRARDWELQMLIKGRAAAGDAALGRELLEFVEPLTYTSTLDFSAVESMSATRDRIDERLMAKRGGAGAAAFDIKLARGGIRDIEFLVQCLQRLHGGRAPWVRHAGTLLALSRLHDKALLSETEYWRLASAYQFLRHLEHRLQFEDDRQTHTLPTDPVALDLLARRMPSGFINGEPDREHLLQQLNAHLEQVIAIYERVIHAQKPIYYTVPAESSASETDEPGVESGAAVDDIAEPVASNLVRSLDQRAPALAEQIARAKLKRSTRAFEHFLERVLANPEWVGWLNDEPVLAAFVLDLFEHSPYFAEELIRHPELLAEVRAVASDRLQKPAYMQAVQELADPVELRRFFQREMMRTQADSICLHAPIFDTLGRTSDLADAVITAAYRMALEHTRAAKPPQDPAYEAADQLMVIALGRLGMREFDLASDADLLFVIPDEDSPERLFWTRVAEKTINILTAYTGEGVMFAVDTRLRPNGREGALVQTTGNFKDYFARNAEAWEGIAYMKSRAVVGNLETATEFLHQLQDVDWRRYGQGGRSKKDLRQMRLRLEKEQGGSSPLKAGRGGFYDIDFALLYLRLKGAGLFFKVLNTPERIDLIERMGHLDREDAAFLLDAAVFFRSVDHGLRVSSGHAEGNLPTSEAKLEILEELVRRWTPDRMHGDPLRVQMAQIQDKNRAVFERLFA